MDCTCCMVYDMQAYEGNVVIDGAHTISIDMNINYDWVEATDDECVPTGERVNLYGPAIGTIAINAHPFATDATDPLAYTLGFTCPIEIQANFPWQWKWDCRTCEPCMDPLTGEWREQTKGRWVPIPGKKKDVRVSGDISGISSSLAEFGDQLYRLNKLQVQAGAQAFILPQPTYAYSYLKYHGSPLEVETTENWIYEVEVRPGNICPEMFSVSKIDAMLTSFSLSFQPPNPVTVTYNFQFQTKFCND